MSAALAELCLLDNKIDQFRYIKIQPKSGPHLAISIPRMTETPSTKY